MFLVMPIVAICLDKRDYDALKNDEFDISDELLRRIASKKGVPFEFVAYKKK
jgi:hypothetical protein